METTLTYAGYALAAVGALALFVALPRDGRLPRVGLVWLTISMAIGVFLMVLSRLTDGQAPRWPVIVLSLLAVGGAMRVVTHPRPVYSALYFILVVLSTAGMMFAVGAEFLGAALVIVYAGAILVTYVFVIMLAQQSSPTTGGQFAAALDYDRNAREPAAAVLASFVLVGLIAGQIVGHDWSRQGAAIGTAAADAGAVDAATADAGGVDGVSHGVDKGVPDGNVLALGRVLTTDFAVSMELAGVLLMIAMIGAIMLARKRLPTPSDDSALPPGEIGRRVKPF